MMPDFTFLFFKKAALPGKGTCKVKSVQAKQYFYSPLDGTLVQCVAVLPPTLSSPVCIYTPEWKPAL